jgi:hypothetical protein
MRSWQELFDAGMTAPQAAAERGQNRLSAYKWAKKVGVSWPSSRGSSDPRRARPKHPMVGFVRVGPVQTAVVESGRGRFWGRNEKTGEEIRSSTAAGIYRQAQLKGWTDWEHGDDQEAVE